MSELQSEYQLQYFDDEGFSRKQCPVTDVYFWTRDPDQETCGEPPADDYSFIDNPGFDTEYSLEEMREEFLSFFDSRDHERIDPYPVAANRWRDDVLLTQASIYDFQPLVTSGETPPPANPLCISQPCIRMQDIDNVGKTGRHTMAFEMMAHHAFNTREEANDEYAYSGETYWKNETVRLCDTFFEHMGANLDEITYIEDPWVGGGNAGPAFEVLYRGAELATLVFMSLEQDAAGEYEMKDGNRYSPMDTYVVDTGYGLERWTWVSQGTPTVYEAIYPDTIEFLKSNAGISLSESEKELVHEAAKLSGYLDIDEADSLGSARAGVADELGVSTTKLADLLEPLEHIYAIADHSRTLAYMLGDEIVPSNVGTGYLARMVLRRTKRLVDEVGIDAPLDELVDMQADRLGYTNRDTIRDIVRTEHKKYRETLKRGRRRVESLADTYADRDEPIPVDDLVELYDSHGIQPDMVTTIAADRGAAVEIPDDFYSLVAARHEGDTPIETDDARSSRLTELPPTEKLYYDDQDRTEFEAVVLDVFDHDEGYGVVLDQTMFYPEGGGQPADHGTLTNDDITAEVTDVQSENDVIVHHTDTAPQKGEFVRGQLDVDRRHRLMRHHTATHIIGAAARRVVGEHIRQAGAQKGTNQARLDITHYERLSDETVASIEATANRMIRQNHTVKVNRPDRHEAEQTHGFDLYQGGIPPGQDIRTITIAEDTQACGGTHVSHTGDIGAISILNTEPIQDGVERVTFAAGEAAIDAVQETKRTLADAADVFDVAPAELPSTAERFFSEWKARGKKIESLKAELAEARAADASATSTIGDVPVVVDHIDGDIDELRANANAVVKDGSVAVYGSKSGGNAQFVVGVPDDVDINAGAVVSELASRVGGGGGGPPDFAQGGGPNIDHFETALEAAPSILRTAREA